MKNLLVYEMKNFLMASVLLLGAYSTVNPLYAVDKTKKSQVVFVQKEVQRTLWGAKISPYVLKVLITLEEKNAPYKLEEILPAMLLKATDQKIPGDFSRISPFGKIPAYVEKNSKSDEHFSIAESLVIMEYINDTTPGNLHPKCPKARANVLSYVLYGDNVLAPLTHKMLFENVVKPDVLKENTDSTLVENLLKEKLPPVLDFLEETLADKRTWIADTKNFSFADITIASHLITISKAGLNLEETIGEKRPNLVKYMRTILNRPSVKKALA